MQLLFSEVPNDYANYLFPYVIWAIPGENDSMSQLYELGFMISPAKHNPKPFYLSRSLRIKGSNFSLSSENRRILRKHLDIDIECIPREHFELTEELIQMCLTSAEQRYGANVMSRQRLMEQFNSEYTTHLICYRKQKQIVGVNTLLIDSPNFAHLKSTFYDVNALSTPFGVFNITSTIVTLLAQGLSFVYLGSCYLRKSLYKTQFAGCEFFNGNKWSSNMGELKYLIARHDEYTKQSTHILESFDYLEQFSGGTLEPLISATKLSVVL